jgi:hypothetical protein
MLLAGFGDQASRVPAASVGYWVTGEPVEAIEQVIIN